MSKHQSGAFLAGLLAGATAGALAGLLLAPRKGRETRKLLAKSVDALPELVEDLATTLQRQGGQLSTTAAHRWGGTLARLREAIAAGIEATQNLEEEGADVGPEDPEGAGALRDRQRRYPKLAKSMDAMDQMDHVDLEQDMAERGAGTASEPAPESGTVKAQAPAADTTVGERGDR